LPKPNNLIANITIALSKPYAGIYGRGLSRLLYSIRYNYLRDTPLGVMFRTIVVITLAFYL